jgi:ubiquitin-protein ligase
MDVNEFSIENISNDARLRTSLIDNNEMLDKEYKQLEQFKIELLQNNKLIKSQYEELKSKYRCYVESLLIIKITDKLRITDDIETNKFYLQQLSQASVTKDNEEEFQNVYGMIDGLTIVIGCSFNYPIEAPLVKILSNYELFHPNVAENGVMKFSLIDRDWCVGITLTKLVEVVKETLAMPDLNAIANKEAAVLYIYDKTEYYKRSVMNVIEINSGNKIFK